LTVSPPEETETGAAEAAPLENARGCRRPPFAAARV